MKQIQTHLDHKETETLGVYSLVCQCNYLSKYSKFTVFALFSRVLNQDFSEHYTFCFSLNQFIFCIYTERLAIDYPEDRDLKAIEWHNGKEGKGEEIAKSVSDDTQRRRRRRENRDAKKAVGSPHGSEREGRERKSRRHGSDEKGTRPRGKSLSDRHGRGRHDDRKIVPNQNENGAEGSRRDKDKEYSRHVRREKDDKHRTHKKDSKHRSHRSHRSGEGSKLAIDIGHRREHVKESDQGGADDVTRPGQLLLEDARQAEKRGRTKSRGHRYAKQKGSIDGMLHRLLRSISARTRPSR